MHSLYEVKYTSSAHSVGAFPSSIFHYNIVHLGNNKFKHLTSHTVGDILHWVFSTKLHFGANHLNTLILSVLLHDCGTADVCSCCCYVVFSFLLEPTWHGYIGSE